MATKKKSKKKTTKRKTARKAASKKATPRKKLAKKKAAPKRTASAKKASAKKKRVRGKREIVDRVVFEPRGLGAATAGQSGDLQGLSDREGADSESVGELLEEGNAFEAEVVKGVEDAGDADEGEVVTHEVPEDDVPGEYRDEK
jgi:hypothetical protein